ncbi:MAG: flagellar biosynthesis protein FlhB [Limnohabitans sp.]|jgi:flagellar biosynthetic protein FlhB|nr:flagellar biosynthesis protein FlhB [Limnohabitans sp.]
MADDLGERTEDPTPKRLREAREEGNIARSTDAANALLLLGGVLVLASSIKPFLGVLASLLEKSLAGDHLASGIRPEEVAETVIPAVSEAALAAAPIVLGAAAIGVLAQLWQVGFLISTKSLEPKFERLDPIKGFGRMFGAQGAIKTAMDILKVVIVGWIAYSLAVGVLPRIVALPELGVLAGFEEIGSIGLTLAIQVGAALLVLGIADYAVQRFKHMRDLRMTKQQVKEEMKESDGNPEVKRRRMQIARQMAMQRLQTAVPKADVIVTNPEHISVAIQYDPSTMAAPRIVAMGADHLAFRIRQIAMKHGIPIVERKPLARALYANAKVGQEIPADHYKAVAEILAYVYNLKGKAVA